MLTARTSARYALRAFGYLLATTLAAGVVVGVGAGVAYYMEPSFFTELPPGGPAVDLTALAVFGAFAALGLLVFASGLIVILFTAVADAVAVGTEATGEDGTDEPTDDSAAEEPDAEGPSDETTEPVPAESDPVTPESEPATAESEPAPAESEPTAAESDPVGADDDPLEADDHGGGQPAGTEPDSRDEEPMDTDPFAEAAESDTYDPTDPIDDPHEAQTNPFDEPEEQPTAEEWTSKAPQGEDDDAWREEIEAKLDDEE